MWGKHHSAVSHNTMMFMPHYEPWTREVKREKGRTGKSQSQAETVPPYNPRRKIQRQHPESALLMRRPARGAPVGLVVSGGSESLTVTQIGKLKPTH